MKNKLAPPFRQVEFDIIYGEGISKVGELIDLGVKVGVVEKSGAWFSCDSQRIGQGRENAKQFLREHREMADAIEVKVREQTWMVANSMMAMVGEARRPKRLNDATPPAQNLSEADHALIASANDVLARHYHCSGIRLRLIRACDGRSGRACILAQPFGGSRCALKLSHLAARCLRVAATSTRSWLCATRNPISSSIASWRWCAVLGACRKMFLDHCPDALVIMHGPWG